MVLSLRARLGLAGLQALAFWPVWRWLWTRASTEGLAGLTPLLILLALLWRRAEWDKPASVPGLRLATVLALAYSLLYASVPQTIRAGLAFSSLAAGLSALFLGRAFSAGSWLLLLLGLPILPSMQFYFGYPLRAASGEIAAFLLRCSGLEVRCSGTLLEWGTRSVMVDAPCSGINTWWAASFLCAGLAAWARLPFLKAMLLMACAVPAVVFCGGLRTLSLFFLESGWIESPPSWAHSGVGLVTFMMAAGMVAGMMLLGGKKWSASS